MVFIFSSWPISGTGLKYETAWSISFKSGRKKTRLTKQKSTRACLSWHLPGLINRVTYFIGNCQKAYYFRLKSTVNSVSPLSSEASINYSWSECVEVTPCILDKQIDLISCRSDYSE